MTLFFYKKILSYQCSKATFEHIPPLLACIFSQWSLYRDIWNNQCFISFVWGYIFLSCKENEKGLWVEGHFPQNISTRFTSTEAHFQNTETGKKMHTKEAENESLAIFAVSTTHLSQMLWETFNFIVKIAAINSVKKNVI